MIQELERKPLLISAKRAQEWGKMEKLLHTPEGVRDIYNSECEKKLQIESKLHGLMKQYGFMDIQTPTFEFFEVFSEERGTVSSRDMYKFFDRAGNTLVLRPDMTPSIARCYAKYYKDERFPIRLCYGGSTFINHSEYQGKLKEVSQLGAELINDSSVEADTEMIALTVECLLKIGIKEFQVEVGQTDFFRALVEEAMLDEEETEQLRLMIMNKNMFGIEDILSGKTMSQPLKNVFLKLPELFGNINRLSEVKSMTDNSRAIKTIERLEQMYELLKVYGFEQYITFDLGALSQYNYYTGIIFHAYTYGTGNAIITGGRYDSLVGQFGKDAPAVGMAILIDQLMAAMSRHKSTEIIYEKSIMILYKKGSYERAVLLVQKKRSEGRNCILCSASDEDDPDSYKPYALRIGIDEIIIVD